MKILPGKPRLVKPGGDLVESTGAQLGIRLDDLERQAVECTRRRLRLAMAMFCLIFAVLGVRLSYLTVGHDGMTFTKRATAGMIVETRPNLVDRNETLMTAQVSAFVLGADATAFGADEAERMTAQLEKILPGLNRQRVKRFLQSSRRYVELKRGLTPQQYQAVLALGNPALKLQKAERRMYPHGRLAAHVLGFVGHDTQGLAGLELALEKGELEADALNQIPLTLDVRVQHSVRAELAMAVEKYAAKGGSAIIMDVRNGDILSMVSLPDFDPNNKPGNASPTRRFNRAAQGRYELGSIFKVFTAAMVLETGAVKPDQKFQTSVPISIGRHKITDDHGEARPLTVDEIVVHSSNIGSAQLALSVSPEIHHAFLARLGLLDRPIMKLPELATPTTLKRWGDIERATSSYGYGVAVSPLQAITAVAACVNGGILYEPRLTADGLPLGERVVSAQTSLHIRNMMRAVVTQGTATQAYDSPYMIIGKTGTARVHAGGEYDSSRLVTSFLGAFPAHAPRYAFIVMLEEPQSLAETHGLAAGWNAVPVARKIVNRIAPLLNVMPVDPAQQMAELFPIREGL